VDASKGRKKGAGKGAETTDRQAQIAHTHTLDTKRGTERKFWRGKPDRLQKNWSGSKSVWKVGETGATLTTVAQGEDRERLTAATKDGQFLRRMRRSVTKEINTNNGVRSQKKGRRTSPGRARGCWGGGV